MSPRHAVIAAGFWLRRLDEISRAFDLSDTQLVSRDPMLDACGLAGQVEEYACLCDKQNAALRSLDTVSFKIIQEPSRLSVEEIETYFSAREAVIGVYCHVDC